MTIYYAKHFRRRSLAWERIHWIFFNIVWSSKQRRWISLKAFWSLVPGVASAFEAEVASEFWKFSPSVNSPISFPKFSRSLVTEMWGSRPINTFSISSCTPKTTIVRLSSAEGCREFPIFYILFLIIYYYKKRFTIHFIHSLLNM